MRPENPFEQLAIGELFETLLPDFVLASAFFPALAYAVFGNRFSRQRPAVDLDEGEVVSVPAALATIGRGFSAAGWEWSAFHGCDLPSPGALHRITVYGSGLGLRLLRRQGG